MPRNAFRHLKHGHLLFASKNSFEGIISIDQRLCVLKFVSLMSALVLDTSLPSGAVARYASFGFQARSLLSKPTSALLPRVYRVEPRRLTMRCSEPGHRALVAIHASRGPGR